MTKIKTISTPTRGSRLVLYDDAGTELGYAHLVVIENKSGEYLGLLENLVVDPSHRGRGIGTQLVQAVITQAKAEGCYKLICTSRYGNDAAHHLYQKLGFTDWGKEFRLDLN